MASSDRGSEIARDLREILQKKAHAGGAAEPPAERLPESAEGPKEDAARETRRLIEELIDDLMRAPDPEA